MHINAVSVLKSIQSYSIIPGMSTSKEGYMIRPYSPDDRKPLMDFFMKLQNGNRGWSEHLMQCILTRNVSVLVAELEADIVGYGETHRNSFRSVYFHRAAVLREHRRQGIFTGILYGVLAAAGKSEITAEVSRDAHHLPAMLRNGFCITDNLDGYRYQLVRSRQRYLR